MKNNHDNEIIYGRQPVLELLKAGRRSIKRVFLFSRVRPSSPIKQIRKLTSVGGLVLENVDHPVLDRLVGGGNHQGVVAEVGGYPYESLPEFQDLAGLGNVSPLFLLLDQVQDPQNLGAILRTADAVGVDAVLLPKDRSAQVTPSVVRVSAGASEHLTICRIGNLHRQILALQECDFRVFALDMQPNAIAYTAVDFTGPVGLVIGSEGYGVGRLVRDSCDTLLKIPMRGKINSLNASAATAVALYEILRQRED